MGAQRSARALRGGGSTKELPEAAGKEGKGGWMGQITSLELVFAYSRRRRSRAARPGSQTPSPPGGGCTAAGWCADAGASAGAVVGADVADAGKGLPQLVIGALVQGRHPPGWKRRGGQPASGLFGRAAGC